MFEASRTDRPQVLKIYIYNLKFKMHIVGKFYVREKNLKGTKVTNYLYHGLYTFQTSIANELRKKNPNTIVLRQFINNAG